jgi:hypothetical protein
MAKTKKRQDSGILRVQCESPKPKEVTITIVRTVQKHPPPASDTRFLVPSPEMQASTDALRRKLAVDGIAERAGYRVRELFATRDGKPLYAVELLSGRTIDEVERFFTELTAPTARPPEPMF